MIKSLPSLKVTVFFICLCFNMVSLGATPRSVSFGGLIQTFPTSIPAPVYASPPPRHKVLQYISDFTKLARSCAGRTSTPILFNRKLTSMLDCIVKTTHRYFPSTVLEFGLKLHCTYRNAITPKSLMNPQQSLNNIDSP